MNKKIFTIMTVLLIAVLATSPVSAGNAIKLSRVQFSLGSLIATGFAGGLGNTDVTVVLEAIADDPQFPPQISCINGGGNIVPGQSFPKVDAFGTQNLAGNDPLRKNGKSPFNTETSDFIPWDEAGCPNSNWVGHLDIAFWTKATLFVYQGINVTTGTPLLTQKYTCDPALQTATTVSCTLVP